MSERRNSIRLAQTVSLPAQANSLRYTQNGRGRQTNQAPRPPILSAGTALAKRSTYFFAGDAAGEEPLFAAAGDAAGLPAEAGVLAGRMPPRFEGFASMPAANWFTIFASEVATVSSAALMISFRWLVKATVICWRTP